MSGRNRDITSVTLLWAHSSEVCIPPALCCVLRQGDFCTVTLLLTGSQTEEGYWKSSQWYLGAMSIELERKSVKWQIVSGVSCRSVTEQLRAPWAAAHVGHGLLLGESWACALQSWFTCTRPLQQQQMNCKSSVKGFLNKREFNFRNMKYSHIITHQVVGDTCRKQSAWKRRHKKRSMIIWGAKQHLETEQIHCIKRSGHQDAGFSEVHLRAQQSWDLNRYRELNIEGWIEKQKVKNIFFSLPFNQWKRIRSKSNSVSKITSKTLEHQIEVFDEKHQPKQNETLQRE